MKEKKHCVKMQNELTLKKARRIVGFFGKDSGLKSFLNLENFYQ